MLCVTGQPGKYGEFPSSLEQSPATITPPATVTLTCKVPLTESQISSIIWYIGTPEQEVYAQTKTASAPSPEYEDVIDVANSTLRLSADGSDQWSEARLVMQQVTRCDAGLYRCLVTDVDTRQSERTIQLNFVGKFLAEVHVEFQNIGVLK